MDTSSILKKLNDAHTKNVTGSREEMLSLAHSLVASLETPSEVISRVGWAEVSQSLQASVDRESDLTIKHSPHVSPVCARQ